jgi:hypothetical protein
LGQGFLQKWDQWKVDRKEKDVFCAFIQQALVSKYRLRSFLFGMATVQVAF